MYILGLWDGHDAGAAIIEDNKIKVAINEERITRKKLDIGFPRQSIKACLDYLKIKPADIKVVAASTSDFSKTLTRIAPKLKDRYYLLRRRKILPRFSKFQKSLKYTLTEIGSTKITRRLSQYLLRRELKKLGFEKFSLHIVDHHMAHAASALLSGFNKALAITMDGVGDGLSGSVNILNNEKIERIASISSKDSLGIFFEHVTNLLNMRELEDEGKVMALSDYAYEMPDEKNETRDFFEVSGLDIKAKYTSLEMYKQLKNILWHTSHEQFAWMAQKTLEKNLMKFFENAIKETGIRNVAWSGGVASNVKANLIIKNLKELKKWFVFPHMGDGGLALGAALYINFKLNGQKSYKMDNLYFGPSYGDEEIKQALKKFNLKYEERNDIEKYAADLISKENIVLWFQGRMEYGPRALGNRSILAPAFSEEVKDKLNLQIKRREWFQPFCPSLLKEEAKKFFTDIKQYDKFMVMGYNTKKSIRHKLKSVINVDGSARPQMLDNENKKFRNLIKQVKKNTGDGVVLNTSLNLHGFPIVNKPEEAIEVMLNTKSKYLALGNYLIKR
jgi:carbamoyltransferase|tara:strand:- start:271 stop:1950 length:1680 start_codon:yes stop_codon:yes gene_type:complete